MARFACFLTLQVVRKKKSKDSPKFMDAKMDIRNGARFIYSSIGKGGKETTLDDSVKRSTSNEKLVMDENLVRAEGEAETAYEGGDKHDDIFSMKRDYLDFDLQGLAVINQEQNNVGLENKSDREGTAPELAIQCGHVSDPRTGRMTSFWSSPMLKRSCSNIETKRASRLPLSPTKSHSYNDLQNLSGNGGDFLNQFSGSPLSVVLKCSADKVMLKKCSSRQVLPSRSRKLWWKLFLWSHCNLHRPWASRPQEVFSNIVASSHKGGYSSDTLDLKSSNKQVMEKTENESRSDLWQQNQWVAFSAESSHLDRVNAWVTSLDDSLFCPVDEYHDDGEEGRVVFLNTEIKEPLGKNHSHANLPEEVLQANSIIQSLNSFSTVAHVSGMGLKAIHSISAFSSLRAVNLSNNLIVRITPGSLPNNLHVLDLSRNKISTIEGLRELTRLRFLNLSYNRISRISYGLSNCTLIKELYLAGNKISAIEGLHRLLKLSVLDLSFNKITTTKALGQLVAHYYSLQTINLLGNPIQHNIGDDQIRKAICSLLPNLVYLNKQTKTQRVREVVTDSVTKSALGKSGWSSRRKLTRRASPGSSSSSIHKGAGSSVLTQKGSRHRSKSKHRVLPAIKK